MATAYVLANQASFAWLGSRAVVEWVVDAARKARGVEKVVLGVPVGMTMPEMPLTDLTVVEVASGVSEDALPGVTGGEGDVSVFLHPGTAFLTPGTIERAVSAVENEGARRAVTAVRVERCYPVGGPGKAIPAHIEVVGCRVFAPGVTAAAPPVMVEIPRDENLDATTPLGLCFARAYVEAGHG